jgi:hypothetical protein
MTPLVAGLIGGAIGFFVGAIVMFFGLALLLRNSPL